MFSLRILGMLFMLVMMTLVTHAYDDMPSEADQFFQQKDYMAYLKATVLDLKGTNTQARTFDRLCMLTIALEQTKGWKGDAPSVSTPTL